MFPSHDPRAWEMAKDYILDKGLFGDMEAVAKWLQEKGHLVGKKIKDTYEKHGGR